MMKIEYNPTKLAHTEIIERINDLSLAFTASTHEEREIYLQEGEKKLAGEKDIIKYLDDLAGELHSWYYCKC